MKKQWWRETVTVGLVVLMFFMGFLSGCMTVKGLASDIREGSAWVERNLQPVEQQYYQDRVDRAAKLVLKEQQKR